MEYHIEQIRYCVARLADSGQEQCAYLKELAVDEDVDELALDLFDALSLLGWARRRGRLSRRQVAAVSSLDDALREMSGPENAALWSAEALLFSPRWDVIRTLARNALRALA